ncbi:phage integrase family prophage LambdaCh01 [[Clostridium] sordellii ATCC 9714]|nr:phage integrase family prophage LambdaCh01 [[Clostridium] sordellii ATCC 9714] [Paeniclostridium sordellii ATCC 9714]
MKTVSDRLGHTDIKITMNRYSHVLEEMDRKASDNISNIMFKYVSKMSVKTKNVSLKLVIFITLDRHIFSYIQVIYSFIQIYNSTFIVF